MTKIQMPSPVCYRKLEYEDGELIDVEYNGIDQFSFGRKNGDPLITADQAEAYAEARVREALTNFTDYSIEQAAKTVAKCMDYPWEFMPEEGRESMRAYAKEVIQAGIMGI